VISEAHEPQHLNTGSGDTIMLRDADGRIVCVGQAKQRD
jgi:hypothetical protein